MNWETVKKVFQFDGALLDIYVLNTTLKDWQKIIHYLLNNPEYKIELSIEYLKPGLKEINLKQDIEKLISSNEDYNWCIYIYRGQIQINCHGFDFYEIEFDIDPREIQNQYSLELILDFIKNLGKISEKNIILTTENCQEYIIIKYDAKNNLFIYNEQEYIIC